MFPLSDIQSQLRRRALALLSRRDYSHCDLSKKLQVLSDNQSEVDITLAWLQELSYLDDKRYAEAFVRDSIAKNRGPIRIRNELQQKGLSADMIESALESTVTDWLALAVDALQRKFRDLTLIECDAKQKAKAIRYLQYRGFSRGVVFSAVELVQRERD